MHAHSHTQSKRNEPPFSMDANLLHIRWACVVCTQLWETLSSKDVSLLVWRPLRAWPKHSLVYSFENAVSAWDTLSWAHALTQTQRYVPSEALCLTLTSFTALKTRVCACSMHMLMCVCLFKSVCMCLSYHGWSATAVLCSAICALMSYQLRPRQRRPVVQTKQTLCMQL